MNSDQRNIPVFGRSQLFWIISTCALPKSDGDFCVHCICGYIFHVYVAWDRITWTQTSTSAAHLTFSSPSLLQLWHTFIIARNVILCHFSIHNPLYTLESYQLFMYLGFKLKWHAIVTLFSTFFIYLNINLLNTL